MIPKVNIKSPYHTRSIERSITAKISFEKRTLEDNLKNFKEKSSVEQKVNVAYGSEREGGCDFGRRY